MLRPVISCIADIQDVQPMSPNCFILDINFPANPMRIRTFSQSREQHCLATEKIEHRPLFK